MAVNCTKCQTIKELTEFSVSKGKRNSWCKICINIHTRLYRQNNVEYKERKNELKRLKVRETQEKLLAYLKTHPCVDCSENDPTVLDFDHIRDKEFNIAKAIHGGYSWSRIKKEVEKCEIRCANCHRRKTTRELNWFRGR